MTQHILEQDIQEDRQTGRRLAALIGGFALLTVVLGVAVGLAVG